MKNKNGKTGIRIVIGLLVIAGIGMVAFRELTKGVTVRSARASEGAIASYVEERAYTSLPHIYHITMPMQGRIEPIEVQEGDSVTEGQLVARIENLDWLDASRQMDELVSAMGSAVKASAAEIKASEARTAFTEWVWKANEGAAGKAVSEQEKRRSRWDYLDSVVKTEESTASFHAMDAFLRVTRIMQPYVKRNLERTTVKCPVAGVVLKRHVWNERMMNPGEPLLDIGDLGQLEITAEILTEQAVGIEPGDRVDILGETVGNAPMKGTVRRVEPEAFTKLSSLGVEQQRVNVKISFDADDFAAYTESGRSLGLHYRTRVRIITDEKEQVVRIPRTALFRDSGGGWATYRIEEGRARLTTLQIGLANDRIAEVIDGLGAGDVVIDAPESAIVDGTRVKMME